MNSVPLRTTQTQYNQFSLISTSIHGSDTDLTTSMPFRAECWDPYSAQYCDNWHLSLVMYYLRLSDVSVAVHSSSLYCTQNDIFRDTWPYSRAQVALPWQPLGLQVFWKSILFAMDVTVLCSHSLRSGWFIGEWRNACFWNEEDSLGWCRISAMGNGTVSPWGSASIGSYGSEFVFGHV
jgi:hypothetical protein